MHLLSSPFISHRYLDDCHIEISRSFFCDINCVSTFAQSLSPQQSTLCRYSRTMCSSESTFLERLKRNLESLLSTKYREKRRFREDARGSYLSNGLSRTTSVTVPHLVQAILRLGDAFSLLLSDQQSTKSLERTNESIDRPIPAIAKDAISYINEIPFRFQTLRLARTFEKCTPLNKISKEEFPVFYTITVSVK